MYTLAIDPGLTTGAVLTSTASAGTLETEAAIETYDYSGYVLLKLMELDSVMRVVIEQPPDRGSDAQLVGLYHILYDRAKLLRGKDVRTLRPGLWKPVVEAAEVKPPVQLRSRHMKDAWLMSWYTARGELKR